LDARLRVEVFQARVDQTAAKAIPAAHAVDDVDAVLPGEIRLPIFIQHARPIVFAGGNAAAQRDGHALCAKPLGKLARHGNAPCAVDHARVYVRALGTDADHLRGGLLGGHDHIHIAHESRQDLASALAPRRVGAVVDSAAAGDAASAG